MRIQITFLFLCFHLISLGQIKIPTFETNSTQDDSANHLKLLKVTSTYDFSIALRISGYWSEATDYYVLANKGGEWYQFILITNYKDKKGNINLNKQRIIHKKANQVLCDSVWNQLIDDRIFSLNKDSVNHVNHKKTSDTTEEVAMISDGNNYEFVIQTKERLRIIESYEPKYFHDWRPELVQLKYFINCLDNFYRIWKK